MKKLFVTIFCLGLVAVSLSAKPQKDKKKDKKLAKVESVLQSEIDSMSYAFGLNLGTDLKVNLENFPGDTLNLELFLDAFGNALKGVPTIMDHELAQNYFRTYIMAVQEKEAKKQQEAAQAFLDENAKRPEVVTLPSGLQYEILVPAEGPKPIATSEVTVHYEGTLIDGAVFDSSYERGESLTLPLNQVIRGWTEGVQLMSVGAKYKFYIPYTLGYGERGQGQIPPFATLIFTVELLEFK